MNEINEKELIFIRFLFSPSLFFSLQYVLNLELCFER